MAVQSAVIFMAVGASGVRAEDTEVAELTQASSSIEVGVNAVSSKSAKFSEYNGQYKKGLSADLSFDLRSSGANEESATRYRVTGTNLGRETREFGVEIGQQGSFRLNFGYNELLHNISDSYQTPYLGVGTNNLYMPATWIKPVQANVNPNATTPVTPSYNANALSAAWIANDVVYRFNNPANTYNKANPITATNQPMAVYAPTAGQTASMLATAANDMGLFRSVDLYTKRTKYNAGMDVVLDSRWSLSASTSQEHKTGLKPKSYIPSGSETALVLPDPINEDHTQFNLNLAYKGDAAFLNAAYYGSLYQNNINGVTVEEIQGHTYNPLTGAVTLGATGTTATPPSNQFHQFLLTGGYKFSPATKLVADVSYSRNTQDDAFLTNSLPTTVAPAALGGSWLPSPSLHGLVVTKNFDLKLTHKANNDLNLAATFKYNDRNNRTPVNTYFFQDVDAATANNSIWNKPLGLPANSFGGSSASGTSLGGGTNNGGILANRAFSKAVTQLNLDADYRIAKGQVIAVGYDWQKIHRYCDGSWIDCATADYTRENTLRAEWRFTPSEEWSGRVAYARSQRRADSYNINAWLALAPMANVVPDQALLSTGGYSAYQTMQMFGLSAWGPMGKGYPLVATLGTANPGQGYTAAQWATALGITNAQANTQLATLNALSKAQWATYLNTTAAAISDKQLAALNQYFALGNKLSGSSIATRNFLALMPGQQLPFDGDRNRDKLRTSVNWQANEKLSITGGLDYSRDNYTNTAAGLKEGKLWNLNLDGNYALTDNFSIGGFFNHTDQKLTIAGPGVGNNADGSAAATGSLANTAAGSLVSSCGNFTSNAQELINAKVDTCLNWNSDIQNKTNTLGVNLRHKGLAGGKLDLSGSLSLTRDVTSQTFTGGSYVSTLLTSANFGAGATTWSRTYVPAAAMPDVITKTVTLSFAGKYTIDKTSAVRLNYTFQHLSYDDWLYYNNTPGVSPSASLPSMIQAPNYNIHSAGVAYIYTFR